MIKEEFKSEYNFYYRFHIYINNRYSLIMLPPDEYGYLYELYDLKNKEIIDRYDSLIEVCKVIEKLSTTPKEQGEDENYNL